MKSITVFSFALLAGFFLAPIAHSAPPISGQAASANAPKSDASGAISLDVVVTEKSGQPLTGLEPGNFKLLDNKHADDIVSVREANGMPPKADPPAEAILVLDAVNGGLETIRSQQQMLVRFLQENGGELALPTALVIFSDQGISLKYPPTRDGNKLVNYLNANIPGMRPIATWGWDADMEREQLSLKALDFLIALGNKSPGRKLLIWLTPGWRLQTSGQWVADDKLEQQMYNSVTTLSTALRRARVTLYCLDPSGIDAELTFQQIYEAYLKGLDSPKHADYGFLLLQVLAQQTGGKALSASTDLAGLLNQCMEDAKDYYVLTFNPPPSTHPSEFDGLKIDEFHSIEVEVDKSGVKARTRTVYYSEPASGTALAKPAH